MTECGPIICSSRWKDTETGFLWKRLPGWKSASTHRTLKHTPEKSYAEEQVMLGYYKNPEATSQIIDANGWLHTGDLGTIDDEGYVTVRGRSKNLLLTSVDRTFIRKR